MIHLSLCGKTEKKINDLLRTGSERGILQLSSSRFCKHILPSGASKRSKRRSPLMSGEFAHRMEVQVLVYKKIGENKKTCPPHKLYQKMDENTSHARQSVYVGWQITSVLTESLRGLDRQKEKERRKSFSFSRFGLWQQVQEFLLASMRLNPVWLVFVWGRLVVQVWTL